MKILSALPEYIKYLATDSRRITPSRIAENQTAFVALKTRVGDGNLYIKELYEKGLRCFVADSADHFETLTDATFVVTPEGTLDFLIAEAGRRLSQSGVKQIVVTGSKRKTTVKELIFEVLREEGVKVARSPRTWNSAMGVALSLFENLALNPETVITEVGIDAPEQARRIKPMTIPEIGVITGVNDEHDENFKSHAEKIAEKVAIVAQAKKIVYINDDAELDRQIRQLNHQNAVAVDSIAELVSDVTGKVCPTINISTRIDTRQAPGDCVLFIDSFSNDAESLPLSVSLASERRSGRKLTAFLGDFQGDRNFARQLIEEIGGEVFFFDRNDADFVSSLNRHDFRHRLLLMKGATAELINFFDEARHDTTLHVDLDAIVHNFNEYRRLLGPGKGLVAMVKADAYGLGALEVAKTLQTHGAAYLAVAVIDEGVALRKAGVTMPIIVLNPITNRFDALIEHNLEATVFSFEQHSRIEQGIRPYIREDKLPVHLKFDTGMHRVGFSADDLDSVAEKLSSSSLLRPVSIFSHLATADCPDKGTYMQRQLESFDKIVEKIRKVFPDIRTHILNTAGMEKCRDLRGDSMARLGIGLYGFSPTGLLENRLQPVATLVTTIINLQELPSGSTVGYGCIGRVDKDSVIATLPIGYADGIDRRLGNGAISFSIDGFLCPTLGNVCMDLLMIDVTEAINSGKKVEVGTQVEIFGKEIPVETHAQCLETIPYEILTSISPRVRRSYHSR